MPRRSLATALTLLALTTFSAQAQAPTKKAAQEPTWHDIQTLTIEGRGWPQSDLKAPYDRLPAKAEGVVRSAVWGLSHDSAGLVARFATESPELHCRWTVLKSNLALPHMPATGVSGVDLYVKTPRGWHWLATGRPTQTTNTAPLVRNLSKERREYTLYLPLYNGVKSVEIGTSEGASLTPLPRADKAAKPIVFWGTSITQGGCASRPGMVHTAILGRHLDRPVINLGFSGNGKMEPEVAELLAEIDASIYVIDCLPNCTAAEVTERTAPLVNILRKAHPTTPIVLVEDRTYADAFLVRERANRNTSSRKALRAEYEKLLAAGAKHLHYIEGESLLGADGEDTVDGSHPTDLGFLRQAEAIQKTLKPLLAH